MSKLAHLPNRHRGIFGRMQRRIPISPLPHHNDFKTKLRFAWRPRRIGSVLIWFERYEVAYVYVVDTVVAVIEGKEMKFDVGRWVKVSERLING